MEETMKTTIESIRSNYPKLSLKAICDITGLCYQYVLKASKTPIAGRAYDPAEVNYEAIAKIVDRKGIDLDAFDWKTIEAQVKVATPVNKQEDFAIGTEFSLREAEEKKGTVYSVLITTETHLVFIAAGSTQPRVMNWDTFMHQSPRIVK
jgi:hypothetical protein